jgi:hypothetical protein
MKRVFVLVLATLLSSLGFSQQVKISFSAGVNLPFINDVVQPRLNPVINNSTGFSRTYINAAYVDQKFETSPGLQGGFSAHYSVNSKFSISAGLSATRFRYTQKFIISSDNSLPMIRGFQTPIPDPWNTQIIIGTSILNTPGTIRLPGSSTPLYATPPDQGETQVTYLSLPVTADYSFAKKWSVSAGLNTHVIMTANVKRYSYTSTTTGSVLLNAEDKTADGFTNVLIGAVSQVSYQVMKPLSIDLGFSYVLTPIYDQSYTSGTSEQSAHYMVLSLSARYWLK